MPNPVDVGFTYQGLKPHLCLSENGWTWCGATATVVVELDAVPEDCCLGCLYSVGDAFMARGDAALNRSFEAWWAEHNKGSVGVGREAWIAALRQANWHIERLVRA
jgi:hypothetical protein